MRIAGLVLAAGRSSRMGRDKALLDYRGHSFLNHLIFLALPRVDRVVVVLGHNAERIAPTLATSSRIDVVVNADYDRGMLSSLQTGLVQIGEEADWVLWMLVDHPAVRGRSLDRVLDAARQTDAPLVIPRFQERRGHPIAISRRVIRDLLSLPPEASPQDAVRRRYGEALFLDLDDTGVLRDVDTPRDLRDLAVPGRH